MAVNLPDDLSEDDLHQWISDGYVLYKGKPYAYWGDPCTDDDGYIEAFGIIRAHADEGIQRVAVGEVECFWPICGAVNIRKWGKNVSVYVERTGRRQWRRTFNSNCVVVHVPNTWAVQQAFKSRRRPVQHLRQLDMEMVDELFAPTYPTVRDAVEMIMNGNAVSVAVSPQVTLVGDGKGQHAVYYRTSLVGGWCNGVFTASLKGHATDTTELLLREGSRCE